jgi:hypothetical protein
MSLRDLTKSEQNVVLECLRASVEGPFFPDWEFQTIFGLERTAVEGVVNRWPVDDEQDEVAHLAINNALNNLIGYPHRREHEWPQHISVPAAEVGRIFAKWRGRLMKSYFEGIK